MGMEAARDEAALDVALQYLRAAVKAVPGSAEYWNDLGVTEARAGLLTKAKKRFSAALKADLSNAEALRNYNQVVRDLAPSSVEQSGAVHSPSEGVSGREVAGHHTLPLEELAFIPAGPDRAEGSPHFKRPFVVRNAMGMLGSSIVKRTEAAILDYLRQNHGDAVVDFYPQNMLLSRPTQLFFPSLARAMDQIAGIPDMVYRDVDASQLGSYAQWNVDQGSWARLLDFLGVEHSLPYPFQSLSPSADKDSDPLLSCLRDHNATDAYLRATHWFMVLLGEQGAGMYNHQDDLRTASFQLQLVGRKKWSICPPQDSLWDGQSWIPRPSSSEDGNYMYGPAQVNMLSSKINYTKYSRLVNATCFQSTVHPGDLIYYPKDFWHQTYNLATPTLSISGNVVTADCSAAVDDRLLTECQPLLDITSSSNIHGECLEESGTCPAATAATSLENKKSSRYGFDAEMCRLISVCTDARPPQRGLP